MTDLGLMSSRNAYTCRQFQYHTELIRRKFEFYNVVVLVLRILCIGVGTTVITVASRGRLAPEIIGSGMKGLHPIVFMIVVCPIYPRRCLPFCLRGGNGKAMIVDRPRVVRWYVLLPLVSLFMPVVAIASSFTCEFLMS